MTEKRSKKPEPPVLKPGARVDAALRMLRVHKKLGGRLLQDIYPTRYMPHVGRQVMQEGGDVEPIYDLMGNVVAPGGLANPPPPHPREELEATISPEVAEKLSIAGVMVPNRASELRETDVGLMPYDKEGNIVPWVQRPGLAPWVSDEGETRWAMPYILELAGNTIGSAFEPVKGAGVVLGSGPTRRAVDAAAQAASEGVDMSRRGFLKGMGASVAAAAAPEGVIKGAAAPMKAEFDPTKLTAVVEELVAKPVPLSDNILAKYLDDSDNIINQMEYYPWYHSNVENRTFPTSDIIRPDSSPIMGDNLTAKQAEKLSYEYEAALKAQAEAQLGQKIPDEVFREILLKSADTQNSISELRGMTQMMMHEGQLTFDDVMSEMHRWAEELGRVSGGKPPTKQEMLTMFTETMTPEEILAKVYKIPEDKVAKVIDEEIPYYDSVSSVRNYIDTLRGEATHIFENLGTGDTASLRKAWNKGAKGQDVGPAKAEVSEPRAITTESNPLMLRMEAINKAIEKYATKRPERIDYDSLPEDQLFLPKNSSYESLRDLDTELHLRVAQLKESLYTYSDNTPKNIKTDTANEILALEDRRRQIRSGINRAAQYYDAPKKVIESTSPKRTVEMVSEEDRAKLLKAYPQSTVEGRGTTELLEKPSNVSGLQDFVKGSKLVDEQGQPIRLYHGTADNIESFDLSHPNRKDSGWLGTGVYMTDSPALASSYSTLKSPGRGENVMPLYARLENPYYATQAEKDIIKNIEMTQGKEAAREASDAFTKRLREQGYDGVILESFPGTAAASREVVVFEPSHVKSATGNRGTFDVKEPDLTKADGGVVNTLPDDIFSDWQNYRA